MTKIVSPNHQDTRRRLLDWQAFAFAALFVLVAQPAHAVAFDWGALICGFAQQNSGWPNFVHWIAYITGTFFVARGIYLARMWTEDPNRNPIHKVLLYCFTGAALLVFPSFVGVIGRSYFGAALPVGGGYACTAGAVVALGPLGGLDVLARNFVENIRDPFFFFAGWMCWCLGAFFMYRGLNKMSKYNTDPRAYSIQAIIANFTVGAMLMWIGQAKNVFMASIFGGAYGGCGLVTANGGLLGGAAHDTFASCGAAGTGLINWAGLGFVGPTAQFDQAYIAATMFFQIIGFIAFIRGWLLAKAHVEGVGNATMGQALTHIIGGAICMNIIVFLRAAQNTFGVNFFL